MFGALAFDDNDDDDNLGNQSSLAILKVAGQSFLSSLCLVKAIFLYHFRYFNVKICCNRL